MRNLAAIQEALRITRSALAAFCERFLRIEYKENWWKYGIAACVQEDYDERGINKVFPETGDAGDLDLQLLLKLINVYHWDRISERLAWGQKERGLVSALINIRNLYEGHVTPNRERELDTSRTVDILDGIYDFNRLINASSAEKIMKIIKKAEAPIVKQEQQPDIIKQKESETKVIEQAALHETKEPEQAVPEIETAKSEPKREAEIPFEQTGEVHKESAVNTRLKKETPVKTEAKPVHKSSRANPQSNVRTYDEIKYRNEKEKPQPAKRKSVKTSAKSASAELEYTPIRKRQEYYDYVLEEREYIPSDAKKAPAKRSAGAANRQKSNKSKAKKQEPKYINVKRIGFITIFVLLATIVLILLERFLSIAVEFFINL